MNSLARLPIYALTGLLVGCSAAPSSASSSAPSTPAPIPGAWARELSPFPVVGADGIAYEMPFLGGFNVPRPQLVDIDGDGDQDLFLQEKSDELLFFERDDTPGTPSFRWRPGRFSDLAIGEWYRFGDVDGDADADLLSEAPFSYLRLYRNVGGGNEPRFELAADTLRDTFGAAIFSDRQNIPNAADLDCDGLLDLLIGRLAGTVSRYEATGAAGGLSSPFRHLTDRFQEIEILGSPLGGPDQPPEPPPASTLGGQVGPFRGGRPTLHGANTIALADIEGDGDTDLFWGDFFEPGLLFIENRGSCSAPNFRGVPEPFPIGDPIETSGYNAATFGDLDGDQDLDLLIGVLGGAYDPNTTTVDNLLYLSQGPDGFELVTRRFLSQVDVGSESVPALHDLDGDGDLDLLLANRIDPDVLSTSRVFLFENVGTPTAPSLEWRGPVEVDGAYHNVPALGDLDGDGDPDLLLGTWQGELRYLENVGSRTTPAFRLVDSTFVQLERGSNAAPTLGDLDGDGDLDLVVGESEGTLSLFENVGDPGAASFRQLPEALAGIDVGRRSFPVLVDLDGDTDLDLAVGTEGQGIVYYENQGAPTRAVFRPTATPFPPARDLPSLSTPAFGDVDADGDLDMVVGGAGGGAYFFEQLTAP